MKKEKIVAFFKNELDRKRLAANTLSEDAKAIADESIKDIEALIVDMEAAEEEASAEDLVKALEAKIDEKLKALAEKVTEEPKTEPEMTENYLESKNALHDFAEAIRETKHTNDFNGAWGRKLSENGISFESGAEAIGYLPAVVKGKIADAWEKNFKWFGELKHVGAKNYAVRYNTSTQSTETSRAKGHKRGEAKQGETITLDAKSVLPKAVYKLIKVDNEIIWNDDNSLVDYVVEESTNQWYYEVCQAILVGDGRSSATPDLRVQGIESINRVSTDAFVTVATRDAVTYPTLIEELTALIENVNTEGTNNLILFISKANLNELRKVVASSTGTPVYMGLDQLADMLMVKSIVPTTLLGSVAEAIVMDPKGYVVVGGDSPRFASQEDLEYNQMIYRFENFIGGAVETPKSAAILLPAGE